MTTEIIEQRQAIDMGPRGLVLKNNSDMGRFADLLVRSGLAPKGLNKEGIIIALQLGKEVGLTPMAAIQNIAVINGRPTLWGDSMLAVCRASEVFDEGGFDEFSKGEGDKLTAYCTVRRLPNGKPQTREFSVEDAKRAKLWGKSGPWSDYPKRMLQMRARSYVLRDVFPDFLKGTLSAEEVQDSNYAILPTSGSSRIRIIDHDFASPALPALEAPAEPATTTPEATSEPVEAVAVAEPVIQPDSPRDAADPLEIYRQKIRSEFGMIQGAARLRSRYDQLCGPEGNATADESAVITSEYELRRDAMAAKK